MANLRRLKKDIDYVLEELVFDCDMAFYYQPEKEKEIFDYMKEARSRGLSDEDIMKGFVAEMRRRAAERGIKFE